VSEADKLPALVAQLTAEKLTLESGVCFETALALLRKKRLRSAWEYLRPVD
jgi:hypothetical protein